MPVNRTAVGALTLVALLGWAIVALADLPAGQTNVTAANLGLRTGEAAVVALLPFAVGPPRASRRRFAAAALGLAGTGALLAWVVDLLSSFSAICAGGMMCDSNPPLPGEPDWHAAVRTMGWIGLAAITIALVMLVLAGHGSARSAQAE